MAKPLVNILVWECLKEYGMTQNRVLDPVWCGVHFACGVSGFELQVLVSGWHASDGLTDYSQVDGMGSRY